MKKVSLLEILTLLWSVFPIGEGSKITRTVRNLPYPPLYIPPTLVVDGLDVKPFFKLTNMNEYEFISLWDSVVRFLPQKGRRNSVALTQLVKIKTRIAERYIDAMFPDSRVKFHELALLGFIANETMQNIDFTDGAHITLRGVKLGVNLDGQVFTSSGDACSQIPVRDYQAYLTKPIQHPEVSKQLVFYHTSYDRALRAAKKHPEKYQHLPTLVLLLSLHFVNFFEIYTQTQPKKPRKRKKKNDRI